MQKPATFHSEKRCKDKEKESNSIIIPLPVKAV